MIADLLLAQFVAVATPFYEYMRWLIETAEPYMPIGKLEEYETKE